MKTSKAITIACTVILVFCLVVVVTRRDGNEKTARTRMSSREHPGVKASMSEAENVELYADSRDAVEILPEAGREEPQENTRLVAKEADVRIRASNVSATADLIAQKVENLRGVVVSSNHFSGRVDFVVLEDGMEEEEEVGEHVDITVQVPSESFQKMLQYVKTLATKVMHVDVRGGDVTGQAVDTGARLKSLQDSRDRLLSLLETAKSVSDALSVQRELSRVTEQLEIYKARLKSLQDSASGSVLHIFIEANIEAKYREKKPRILATLKAAFDLVEEMAVLTMDILIYVVVVSIPLLMIGVAAYALSTRFSRPLLYFGIPSTS